jgi:hypothetical protein
VPQTIRFVRFVGDRVTLVEIAALGKPIEIHNTNEMGDYEPGVPTREVALGDPHAGKDEDKPAAAPSLRLPGEAAPAGGPGKVQFPTSNPAAPIPAPPSADIPSGTDPGAGPGTGLGTNPGITPSTIPGIGPGSPSNPGANPGTSPQSTPRPPI